MKTTWILDSGASTHCCCLKEYFKFIEPYQSIIKVGNGSEVKVEGKGTVELKVKAGDELITLSIEDTLYVPNLSLNLISICNLSNRGYSISF